VKKNTLFGTGHRSLELWSAKERLDRPGRSEGSVYVERLRNLEKGKESLRRRADRRKKVDERSWKTDLKKRKERRIERKKRAKKKTTKGMDFNGLSLFLA